MSVFTSVVLYLCHLPIIVRLGGGGGREREREREREEREREREGGGGEKRERHTRPRFFNAHLETNIRASINQVWGQ